MRQMTTDLISRADNLNVLLGLQGAPYRILYQEVDKNGTRRDAFVLKGDTTAAPVVYPDSDWNAMTDEELAKSLTSVYATEAFSIDMEEYLRSDFILATVRPRLVGDHQIEDIRSRDLVALPYMGCHITFAVPVTDLVGTERGTLRLTKAMLEQAGVGTDDLLRSAIENIADDVVINDLGDMIGIERTSEPQMLVATTNGCAYGAAVILVEDVLQRLHQMLGERFFVIPSSVHEVLCIPYDGMDPNAIREMVIGINAAMVSPEDKLSDEVFFCEGNTLYFAE